jgi:hypothetical protein
MTIINEQFLKSVGINLSVEETALLSKHFETTLNSRIFSEIINELDQKQAEELVAMTDRNDPALTEWFRSNVPELSGIVQDEVDILLGELVENSDNLQK